MSLEKTNFLKLVKVIPCINNLPDSSKSVVSGFMDLNLDTLSRDKELITIALSHYYKHPSGDMIPDPDMTMEVHLLHQTVQPLTYQDIYLFDDVYINGNKNMETSRKLGVFLSQWLDNLHEQGHLIK